MILGDEWMPIVPEDRKEPQTSKRRCPALGGQAGLAFAVLCVAFLVASLSTAAFRPVVLHSGRHNIWLGLQGGLDARWIQVSPGWYRVIMPQTINGAWGAQDDISAVAMKPSAAGARPWTQLHYFRVGPFHYAVLLW